MRGLIIAAPQSGSGKTAFTQAFIKLLVREQYPVVPAKVGPDYIDPQFLSLAAEKTCVNLDVWGMRAASRRGVITEVERHEPQAVWVVEGVMGLFDGAIDGTGSTADLAAEYSLPVVLVINARQQSFSVAALVQGFARFHPEVSIAALVLNQVGSDRHAQMLRRSLAQHCPELPILAEIRHHEDWVLPQRHLGLAQPDDRHTHQKRQARMAERLRHQIDWDVLQALLEQQVFSPVTSAAPEPVLLPPPAQRLAVAHDAAFAFVYGAQLAEWRRAGIEIHEFSPLADQAPPISSEVVWLPGGYPELHARTLANARQFHAGMHQIAAAGGAIHGECGGYMVLGECLETPEAERFPMLGLLPVRFDFHHRRRALGYRQLSLCTDHVLGHAGQRFRAHEFHYADSQMHTPLPPLFSAQDALGQENGDCGVVYQRISGSFQHVIDRVTPNGA